MLRGPDILALALAVAACSGGEPSFDGRPVSAWARDVVAPEPATRDDAARRLVEGGAAARPVLAALLAAPEAPVRRAAATVLAWSPEGTGPVASLLVGALEDGDEEVRYLSAEGLRRAGEAAPGTSLALIGALGGDGAARVRGAAADALGETAPRDPAALPALRAALDDEAPAVRGRAARALGRRSDLDRETLAALRRGMDDPDPMVAVQCSGAIAAAGPDAIPFLLDALEGGRSARLGALVTLGSLGIVARDTLDRIREFTGSPDPDLRAAARRAEGMIAGGRK